MNEPVKLIIDIEKENGAMGYIVNSEDGISNEVVLAGRSIVTIPENERTLKIYSLLEENCGITFCTTQTLDDFMFYPVPVFSIFAFDYEGNCFGTIGGMSDIEDDNYPVGFVNHDGRYGKISDSLKEFLKLVIFFQYWRDIIRYEQMGISYDLNVMEMKQTENESGYYACQCEITEILKLTKNPKSIELLRSNIRRTSEFVVYSSKNEAQIANTFLSE